MSEVILKGSKTQLRKKYPNVQHQWLSPFVSWGNVFYAKDEKKNTEVKENI